MHQTVTVCHTDHPDSIVSSMACIVDLKNKFLKITLLWPWYGEIEAVDDSYFMHYTIRGGHTDHTGSIVSLLACIFELKK